METGIKVENSQQLIDILNGVLPAIRSKAVISGMVEGANLINARAKAALMAGRKGQSNTQYSYYATAFKSEKLKGKTPDELGIRTGVWNKENGYKLRWLEWGTQDRTTFRRKNRLTGEVSEPANRGRITGNNFFFGTVRNQQDEVFRVVSEAIIKSLEQLTASNA